MVIALPFLWGAWHVNKGESSVFWTAFLLNLSAGVFCIAITVCIIDELLKQRETVMMQEALKPFAWIFLNKVKAVDFLDTWEPDEIERYCTATEAAGEKARELAAMIFPLNPSLAQELAEYADKARDYVIKLSEFRKIAREALNWEPMKKNLIPRAEHLKFELTSVVQKTKSYFRITV